jgi:hypothetical protein
MPVVLTAPATTGTRPNLRDEVSHTRKWSRAQGLAIPDQLTAVAVWLEAEGISFTRRLPVTAPEVATLMPTSTLAVVEAVVTVFTPLPDSTQ